jgi:hypothetical protein
MGQGIAKKGSGNLSRNTKKHCRILPKRITKFQYHLNLIRNFSEVYGCLHQNLSNEMSVSLNGVS